MDLTLWSPSSLVLLKCSTFFQLVELWRAGPVWPWLFCPTSFQLSHMVSWWWTLQLEETVKLKESWWALLDGRTLEAPEGPQQARWSAALAVDEALMWEVFREVLDKDHQLWGGDRSPLPTLCSVEMGIDKNLAVPIQLLILLDNSIPYELCYLFLLVRQKSLTLFVRLKSLISLS